jgi:hypothetical protein
LLHARGSARRAQIKMGGAAMLKMTIPAIGSFPELEISFEEYKNIIKSRNNLFEILAIEEKFDFIVGNYYDLEKAILDETLKDYIYNTNGILPIYQTGREISRRILNYLSSAKLFLDQVGTNLSKIGGYNLSELKDIVKKTRQTNMNFIILETLRNHMQHYGIPLTSGRGNSRITGKKKNIFIHYNQLSINIDEFFKDTKVRKDLSNIIDREKKLDLNQVLRTYFEDLSLLTITIREKIDDIYKMAVETIDGNIAKYAEVYPFIKDQWQKVIGIIEENKMGIQFEFSRNAIELIEDLRSKNCNHTNIKNRFVTNLNLEGIDQIK